MKTTSEPIVIPWKSITPLGEVDRVANGSIGALDALRAEWERRLNTLTEEERAKVRHRSLRRLAIETGILERLYEVDWGLTLTLIAEGFTRDVVERSGGKVDDRTLATLRAQLDSLGLVLDFVRENRHLTPSFIKELHQAMTRTQDTYIATDSLGRITETALPRGEWKKHPNSVLRQDNTLLEYAPPEQVASEIDRLTGLWAELDSSGVHPLVKAAWLHHRFVQIHPFADGNGRVARALTLLVLEKHRYAPLVVDRWHRAEYLKALDGANDGNLSELVQLFIKLESSALTGELERPDEPTSKGLSIDVAHTLAAQLGKVRRRRESEIQQKLQVRATAVSGRMKSWFERKRDELVGVFRARGLADVRILLGAEMPPSSKTHWFHRQVIESARTAGHYADFGVFAGHCNLRIRLEDLQLRYVASIHGAGRELGIMAVTTFAELEPQTDGGEEEGPPTPPEIIRTTKDAFRFVHTESPEDIEKRAPELEALLDEGLAEALVKLLGKV
jgi:fido (protein-threonine AMPylation protein)